MPAQPRTYNPAHLILLVGSRRITGLAEGDDAVSVTRRADEVDLTIGATGEGAFSVSNDRSGEVVIKLLASSPDNAYMQGLLQAQRVASLLNTSVTIKDLGGNDLYFAAFARISKAPDRSWGAKQGAVEWRLLSPQVQDYAGGNL